MDAVVYKTNTGYTAEYAKMLGEKTGLPVYSLSEAEKKLKPGAEIIYLGWLMANIINGYKKASGKYKICAAAGVGMSKTGTISEQVRNANAISNDIPLYNLQGGFNINKLHGIYKLMMKMFTKGMVNDLTQKADKTVDDEDMIDLIKNGGSRVSEKNLAELLAWYKETKQKSVKQ